MPVFRKNVIIISFSLGIFLPILVYQTKDASKLNEDLFALKDCFLKIYLSDLLPCLKGIQIRDIHKFH